MTMSSRLALLALPTLLLGGCGGTAAPAAASAEAPPPPPWQQVIRERDRKRLAGLWSAWTRSLQQVASAGQSKTVAALGDMAAADAADNGPLPTPGLYRCRTVKLGSRDDAPAMVHQAMSKPAAATCTITERGGLLWFEQAAGAQRIGGRLYPDGDRLVFLGSLALAGEMGVRAYGADAERDQVGVLRAIGRNRWRLELPWPMWQANLAIIEIVAP